MAFIDTLFTALRTLTSNKLRSLLTLLGIIIGVVAVVTSSAVIVGLQHKLDEDVSQLGAGVFQVQKYPRGFGPRNMAKIEKRKNFTLTDVNLLQQHCLTCAHVAGEAWEFGKTLVAGDRTKQGVQIAGGTADFFANNGYALAAGRFYSEGDVAAGSDVAVLGSDVVEVLFPDRSPIGELVRLGSRSYRVIGTLERRGATLEGSIDNIISIPLTKFMLVFGTKQSLNVTIAAREPSRISACEDEVVALLRKARGVPPQDENDFDLFSNQSEQERFNEITGAIAMATTAICAISLLIGGIGVMNIMLVAVTERTSEIGVRRALGARRRRILAQFVVEAVMLTCVGGVLGIGVGVGLAWLINILWQMPTLVPSWAIALSMISAGGTGLVFGIYPAYRASQLDPVEAMRHE